MRLIAEFLFWAGRLETVALAVLLLHLALIVRWRHQALRLRLTAAWLAVFALSSGSLLLPFLARAANGASNVDYHLHASIWATEMEAISNLLLRWQNVLLPVYGPWLGLWAAGLLVAVLLSRSRQVPSGTPESTPAES